MPRQPLDVQQCDDLRTTEQLVVACSTNALLTDPAKTGRIFIAHGLQPFGRRQAKCFSLIAFYAAAGLLFVICPVAVLMCQLRGPHLSTWLGAAVDRVSSECGNIAK